MMEKRAPSPVFMEKMSLRDHVPTFDKIANHVKELHGGDVSKKKDTNINQNPVEPPKPYKMHDGQEPMEPLKPYKMHKFK
jgi:hypothetical protein